MLIDSHLIVPADEVSDALVSSPTLRQKINSTQTFRVLAVDCVEQSLSVVQYIQLLSIKILSTFCHELVLDLEIKSQRLGRLEILKAVSGLKYFDAKTTECLRLEKKPTSTISSLIICL